MSETTLICHVIEPEMNERYRCIAGFLSIEATALHELLVTCRREAASQALIRLTESVACDIRDLPAMRAEIDLVLSELAGIGAGDLDEACVSGGAPADLDAAVRFYGARLGDLRARLGH
ncbi:hypothetical protein [Salipiger sp. PrR002]|uniref:hypothetical protein n=1 Tax=Salipiger sp. PrR002 TaxID=2706489 RepID=UPI0013BA9B40|nr:hypothetical protein [Salipiger sp. PrR002]NDW01148.1 hypothetical protein [Salipiger sp. PrR002]NDW58812.1 hypothetical protein [Salipiger sp. PrR004]